MKENEIKDITRKRCAARESNPGRKNGNLAWYHYTSGAHAKLEFSHYQEANWDLKRHLETSLAHFLVSKKEADQDKICTCKYIVPTSVPDPWHFGTALTNGSGSGSRILLLSSLTFKMATKNYFFFLSFFADNLLKLHLHHFIKIRSHETKQ